MIGLLGAVNCAPALAGGKDWTFEQRSDHYGKHTLYVSGNGFRVDSERMGISFMTRPPRWNVTACSLRKKEYLELTADEWQTKFLGKRGASKVNMQSVKKGGTAKIAGLNAVQYLYDNPGSKKVRVKSVTGQSSKNGHVYNTEVYIVPGLKAPAQLGALFQRPMDAAFSIGLVLRIIEYTEDGRKLLSLDTTSAQQKSLSASTFAAPKGYHKAKDEVSMILDSESDSDISNLLLDQGGTTQQKRDKLFGGKR